MSFVARVYVRVNQTLLEYPTITSSCRLIDVENSPPCGGESHHESFMVPLLRRNNTQHNYLNAFLHDCYYHIMEATSKDLNFFAHGSLPHEVQDE